MIAAAKPEQRPVGICSTCGGPLVRLAVEGELASCMCAAASIPKAVIDAAWRLSPWRK